MHRDLTVQAIPLYLPSADAMHDYIATSATDRMRVLWIGRNIPYPMDEGAKIYSAKLAESLAKTGVLIRFMGFGDCNAAPHAKGSPEWLAVSGHRRNKIAALFSLLPIAAAIDATRAYSALLDLQLRERWDVIVLDGYAAGWALQRCMGARAARRRDAPILVHISHNHEEVLWRSMADEAQGAFLARLAMRLNFYKVRALERRLTRTVDLLTAITEEDRHTLGGSRQPSRSVTLTPGYSGTVADERVITLATPRRVIVVGSFRWVIKQENLRRFVELADPIFKQHHITLDVVGEVPQQLLAALQARCQATHFHGFVIDVAPLFACARMAVVPEAIGGGFKLKLLDYVFARVPVAVLSQAAAGLPQTLRDHMLVKDDLTELLAGIVRQMDRIAELNHMQQAAFTDAESSYRWDSRGAQLRQAIDHVVSTQ